MSFISGNINEIDVLLQWLTIFGNRSQKVCKSMCFEASILDAAGCKMAETVDSVSLTLDQHNQVVVNLFGKLCTTADVRKYMILASCHFRVQLIGGTVTSWIQNGSEVIFVR